MSTRAMIHFMEGDKVRAIIYRHPDGYPEGLGKDLLGFLEEVEKNCKDTRFGDAEYLAARWVVREGQRYARKSSIVDVEWGKIPSHPLDFISVGVALEDHTDIEYRYFVHCDNRGARPVVEVEEVKPFSSGLEGRNRRTVQEALVSVRPVAGG